MLVHTFELCAQVSSEDCKACGDFFFSQAHNQPACCYRQKETHQITFNGWNQNGIVVYLRESKTNHSFGYIHLRITPEKVLGCSNPIALFHANEPDVAELSDRLSVLFDGSPLLDIQFYLYRIDLCQDHIVENGNIVAEYIRLLKKGASDQWQIVNFGNEQDKHSCRRVNTRYQVTAYDKLYQLDNRNIQFEWFSKQRILRVEVALLSMGICHMSNKFHLSNDTWGMQLVHLAQYGGKIVSTIFDSLIPPGDYYSLAAAKKMIEQSLYSRPKREKIYHFLKEINRKSMVNPCTIRCHINWKKRLRQLAALNINPATIRSRAGIKHLPSLYTNQKTYSTGS